MQGPIRADFDCVSTAQAGPGIIEVKPRCDYSYNREILSKMTHASGLGIGTENLGILFRHIFNDLGGPNSTYCSSHSVLCKGNKAISCLSCHPV